MVVGTRPVRALRGTLFYVLLSLTAAVYLVPVAVVLLTALKTNPELYSRGLFALPQHATLGNFSSAWAQGSLGVYFGNSLLITAIKVPLHVLVATLAAFALVKMNFRYANVAVVIVVFGMMLPIQAALVPLLITMSATGLLDTYQGIIILYLGFSLPFGIFLARGYFLSIPSELDDAARIDGCGDFMRYWRIVMPLATPILATIVILDFLGTWNELLMALLFLRTNARRTVPIGLLSYRDRYYSDYTLMAAGILIATIPVTAVYAVFQRYFVSGLSAGALKG